MIKANDSYTTQSLVYLISRQELIINFAFQVANKFVSGRGGFKIEKGFI